MNQVAQELLNCMKATKNKVEYAKFRAMYLFKIEKKQASEVAMIVGTTPEIIYQWSHRYIHLGIDGLRNKPRGGRRTSYMTFDEEKAFMEGLISKASKGVIVITKVIRAAAEEKLGHPVSADYAEDLLRRHGWRKIAPRPKHPRSSKSEQEEFKKKCQN